MQKFLPHFREWSVARVWDGAKSTMCPLSFYRLHLFFSYGDMFVLEVYAVFISKIL
jgi:hypothetical protein